MTFGWPLAGFGVVLRLVATHAVYSGGLGTAAFAPCPLERAATLIQWSYSDFSMAWPSTSATALPGTPPHPATSAAGAARAARASVRRTALIMRKPKSRWTVQGSEGPARGAQAREKVARPRVQGMVAALLRPPSSLNEGLRRRQAASRWTASSASAARTTAGKRWAGSSGTRIENCDLPDS